MIKFIPPEFIQGTKEYHLYLISRRSQSIYLLIIVLLLAALALLPLIYVDVSVTANGILRTDIENQTIYANSQGLVLFTRIKNNEKIKLGDTLLVFDSHVQKSRLSSLSSKQNDNQRSINDLEKLVSLDSLQLIHGKLTLSSAKYVSDYNSFRRQYLNQKDRFIKRSIEHQRNTQLYNNGVISASDFEASEFIYNQELTNLRLLFLQQIKLWQDDLNFRHKEQPIIEADLKLVSDEISNRHIISPLNGTIIMSSDIQVGTFLLINQKIAEISPDGELIVLATLPPRDIGYISVGQKVRIQVDAYNYNQWGMLDAIVDHISEDIVFDTFRNLPYYKIQCKLQGDSLIHKNGSVGRLKKGMTVNCRIIQTRRSLFQLLVNKADVWLNPYNKNQNE